MVNPVISFCIRGQNVRNTSGLLVKVLTANFKGNEEGSYESTNEDSEEVYVMNCDEYNKDNEEESVNKKDRCNESEENSDEIGVDGNNDKNEDYGNNDKQDDVSR
jgi:hypothetical protein